MKQLATVTHFLSSTNTYPGLQAHPGRQKPGQVNSCNKIVTLNYETSEPMPYRKELKLFDAITCPRTR